ncbi:hypothetical protein [Pseudofulvibacter geojedonensis]|uniref:Riboflavin synthase subunit beta n=1 Tax=Pseudofulvibacter geojedonensis TaxID=1123758 RepID=A0ABW3HZG5_9FLAO
MGFAQFMVSSIKSNNRRQQRVQFDKEDILNSYTKNKTKPVFKKASQEQLLKIRKRLQKSNQVYQQKLIGYTFLSVVFIGTIIYYFNEIISFIF